MTECTPRRLDLIRRAVDLLREDAEQIDGEWGRCRSADEIRKSGDLGYGWEQVALSDELEAAFRL